ncbi:MAG: hypothetical protein CMB56_006435 [Methanobacteriota archaeon]|nr:MAG: hypothetical protein CMB56_006435 [Euryarchaeota archaeon]
MLDSLPEQISSRCIISNNINKITKDGPIIVWLKSSLRIHENPAIDAGIHLANKFNKPLLIYQAIDERYPHSSLRHHNMLIDGAIDLHYNCKSIGLKYVLHISRENNRKPVMKSFAKKASCIITDLFPLQPWKNWVKKVSKISECPFIEIDCHCIIPLTIFGKSLDRPFKFRDATKKLIKTNKLFKKSDIGKIPAKYSDNLPFTPINIEDNLLDINKRFQILKKCNIDISVLPIFDEKGGENHSLLKWKNFLEKKISGYSKRRNNAADPYGVSRLSYAFHYGFLSPVKVVREASLLGTKSAQKFIDELIIFREHAWHHSFGIKDPYCISNLPLWAIESWEKTSTDPRSPLLSENQLEFYESPSNLWNLCQKSLVRHGELHNNLRMTWGKAIPLWTESLAKSISVTQYLNDKYALDGRDPSSIAGVQWCHGLFDRPFFPSEPILGLVRKRELSTHQNRLDFIKFEKFIERHNHIQEDIFLIFGNTIIELFIARILYDNGINILYVETKNNLTLLKNTNLNLNFNKQNYYLYNRFKIILNDLKHKDQQLIIDDIINPIPKIKLKQINTNLIIDNDNNYYTLNNENYFIRGIIHTNQQDYKKFKKSYPNGFKKFELIINYDTDHLFEEIHNCLWECVEFIYS